MYEDLARPPLRAGPLRSALVRPGSPWTEVTVLSSTPSTNADVAAAAAGGATEGLVITTDHQSAGRGRLDRSWEQPAGAGIAVSVLLQPPHPVARWGWLPLLMGVAVSSAVRETAGVDAGLKWPNDVVVEDRKLAGILVEVPVPGVAVAGVGINVTTARAELPRADATSLALEHATTTDRDTVLRAVLRRLGEAYLDWCADPDQLAAAYRAECRTLGRQVRVDLADRSVTGTATGIDAEGRLLVDDGRQVTACSAGDVVHLRTP